MKINYSKKFLSFSIAAALMAIALVFSSNNGLNAGQLDPTSPPTDGTMVTLTEIHKAISGPEISDDPKLPHQSDVERTGAILLKITEIPGSVIADDPRSPFADSMLVLDFVHEVVSPRDAASGLPTGKRQHKPVTITKRIDKASPLLAQGLINNLNLPSIKFSFFRTNTDGTRDVYYTVELQKASIASIGHDDINTETISFVYEKIIWTWTDGGITANDDWEAPVV
ncbi:MAG: type VI secretion system tube protein Hcp [Phycisphaerae bacterium]|nr:type VI secretion system tube protein Hcp [Phycisphaerae bacterium]